MKWLNGVSMIPFRRVNRRTGLVYRFVLTVPNVSREVTVPLFRYVSSVNGAFQRGHCLGVAPLPRAPGRGLESSYRSFTARSTSVVRARFVLYTGGRDRQLIGVRLLAKRLRFLWRRAGTPLRLREAQVRLLQKRHSLDMSLCRSRASAQP